MSKEGIIQHFTMWVRNTWDSLLPEHVLGKKPPPDLKCVIQSMTFGEMTYFCFFEALNVILKRLQKR